MLRLRTMSQVFHYTGTISCPRWVKGDVEDKGQRFNFAWPSCFRFEDDTLSFFFVVLCHLPSLSFPKRFFWSAFSTYALGEIRLGKSDINVTRPLQSKCSKIIQWLCINLLTFTFESSLLGNSFFFFFFFLN